MVQKVVGPSVIEEQTIRAVASVEPGGLDEVGGSEGGECHLEGHLEVESTEDEGLEERGVTMSFQAMCFYPVQVGLSVERGRGWCRRRWDLQSWKSEPVEQWTLWKQGAWMKWEQVKKRSFTWKDILR